MIDAYLLNLENTLNSVMQQCNNDKKQLAEVEKTLSILRRDLNDLHTIAMLRGVAQKIKKKNVIAFIGTGQLNENSLHAFLWAKMMQGRGELPQTIELMFLASNQSEYDFVVSYGFSDVYFWQYQSKLAFKLLYVNTIVVSTALISVWGNCLLPACFHNATKIQLWHGLPAKEIGIAPIDDTGIHFHFWARMLDDVIHTDYVFIENNLENTRKVYEASFPDCNLIDTGSIRLHQLFDEEYRQSFVGKKPNKAIPDWINQNQNQFKVLYVPTYRENKNLEIGLFNEIKSILQRKYLGIGLAIKLHIAFNFNAHQIQELKNLAIQNGHLYIEKYDEVYSSFPDFDAMITDYSSIRIDFSVLGKPVFLYQFDKDAYARKTDVIELFGELDKVSYALNNFDELSELLSKDEKRVERENFVNHRLKGLLYNDSANKVISNIVKIHNDSLNGK